MLRFVCVACLAPTTAALALSSSSGLRALRSVTRSSIAAQLAPGWVSAVDPASGSTYYYNEQTGETQWEPPQSVPQGWITAYDEQGRLYYINEQTGEGQWEPPCATAAQALWRVDGVAGVAGFSGVAGFAAENKHSFFQLEYAREGRPCQLPYSLGVGEEKVLSRWNMIDQSLTVSRKQCIVRCQSDGSATLTSEGPSPTMWRQLGGAWFPVQKGGSVALADGDQVSLDCNYPERAIFQMLQEGRQFGYQ